MKLADYMETAGLDDEAMAKQVSSAPDDIRCDRTEISRYRRGLRRPGWPVIERLAKVTKGAVTANDWMGMEAAQ